MKSLQIVQSIRETLNLSEDPPNTLIEGSPEYPKLKELVERYYTTLDVHHRHDESVIHQMELIVQGILKRESGQEHYQSAEAASQIVKDLIEKGGTP
jgi:hypothetical protein